MHGEVEHDVAIEGTSFYVANQWRREKPGGGPAPHLAQVIAGNVCPPPAHLGTLVSMGNASGPIGRRVIVTGMAGSGKSTFSRALSARTGLPVIHLDLHYWKPGWVKPSDDEWRVKQRELLAGDTWIADGNYHETLDLRLERADTVIVLDTPWWTCAGRAFVRGVRRPVGTEMPAGCDDSVLRRLRDEWRLVGTAWRDRRKEPERERAIISEHGQHVRLHSFRSKRAVRAFLVDCGSD